MKTKWWEDDESEDGHRGGNNSGYRVQYPDEVVSLHPDSVVVLYIV